MDLCHGSERYDCRRLRSLRRKAGNLRLRTARYAHEVNCVAHGDVWSPLLSGTTRIRSHGRLSRIARFDARSRIAPWVPARSTTAILLLFTAFGSTTNGELLSDGKMETPRRLNRLIITKAL